MVTTCMDCGGAMEAGFIVDAGSDTVKPSEWVAGPPQRSWLTGTRLRGKVRVPLTALRCGECGRVRLYAVASEAAAAAHSELAARVDQLEAELARFAEREQFLMELLQQRGTLAAPAPDDRREPGAARDT
jgi:hypothetical protein